MKFGTLTNVRENIDKLRNFLGVLGQKGSITLTPDFRNHVKFDISNSVRLEFEAPTTLEYEFQSGVLVVKFKSPYPIIHYKLLKRAINFVELTLDRVDIAIDWAPNGYFEVLS